MRWLMRLLRRDRLERELDSEMTYHIDEEARRLAGSGHSTIEARRLALAHFGGLEPMKEGARDARGTRWVEDLWHDLRYAGRMMRRNPAFTVAAVLSLAIGIGANAAVFSIADALLLRPLSVAEPQELAFLNRAGFEDQNLRFSHPGLERFRAGVPEARLAAMSSLGTLQATIGEEAKLVAGQLVTGDWFDLLGVQAAAGRVLTPADTRTLGGQPVAVLSDAFWMRQFARDPRVVGSTIRLNGLPVTIVGVAATGFDGVSVGQRVSVWLPVTLQQEVRYYGNASMTDADGRKPWVPQDGIQWLTIVARVERPATMAAVQARLEGINRQTLTERAAAVADAERRAFLLREHLTLLPGARGLSQLRDDFSAPLGVLMVTVALVLLVACANLASLLLARSAARGREFALRLSLGARRSRLVRQLLTESMSLACLGGLLGVAVAQWGSHGLLRLVSGGPNPVPLAVPVDWRFVGFTAAISLLTGVLFGLAPALRLSRTDLQDALKAGGRVVSASDRRGRLPFGKLLVVGQMALSLVLLVGAVLFLRTFQNLMAVDTGFERDHVLSARFDPRLAGFDEAQLPALYQRLLDQAHQIPGVRTASLAMSGPVTGSARISDIVVEGRPRSPGRGDDVREEFVGPDYFSTVGMTLMRGRDFTPGDDAKAPKIAVVNETMARRFFGDVSPIGRRFGYDEPADTEIVGVVRDAKIDGLRESVPALVYRSLRQSPQEFARNLYIRVTGSPAAARTALSGAVTGADRNLAVREVVSLAELTERTVQVPRLVSRLTGLFGVMAVALACLGLYGTVSYSVVRRTNEIGVRLALGASPARVRWGVLRETLTLVLAGAAAGIAIVLPAIRYVESLLFGLSPRDPTTLAGSVAVLLCVGLVAGAVPAWRASRVDPLAALRAE